MRAALLVLLAACSPEITTGSYLCGPQRACPPGEACDGVTDSCLDTGTEMAFACADGTERTGDDTPGTAQQIPALACVSPPFREDGCMPAGDAADWFKLDTPTTCTSVEVQARLTYPIAYEALSLELWDLGTNISIGTDVPCVDAIGDPAHVERCIKLTVTPGTQYGLLVKPSGVGSCDGGCAFNRYNLSVQLATP